MLLQNNFKMIQVTILNFVCISNLFTNIKGKILQKSMSHAIYMTLHVHG